jgi:hypothetical protein
VAAKLRQFQIEPAKLCSDQVFIRRVFIDTIGTLPTPAETKKFLDDKNPRKRAQLINNLLKRREFTDYWTLKWCDVLRVKSEFPINLWPNAVQAYSRWIHDAISSRMSYDKFARELLTSSGSNFRVPQVNFYRALQGRDPCAIAEAVSLTFMGTRFQTFSNDARAGMSAFFSRVKYKQTAEWKEEIVFLDPNATEPLKARLPDGKEVIIPVDKDPREVFADWLISPRNPWFCQNAVNRVWAWLMGRGIIDKPDDFRPDNPGVNPELLAYLEAELVKSNYDLRHIYRLILNSRTYQQSAIPQSENPEACSLFAFYPVRRLEAEVLADALDWIGGSGEDYSSTTPEPFTYIPEKNRSITLSDGSITSSFLDVFGRPARDTGLESERNNEPSDQQQLYLLNSTQVQKRVQNSPLLHKIMAANRGNLDNVIHEVYLLILSRYPTEDESAKARKYFAADGLLPRQAVADLAWALINSKEFLYRH